MSDGVIDLSFLPPPNVVEVLSFEDILSSILEDFKKRFSDFSAYIENEPIMKLMEAFAYRELMLRQRVNDAARACMVAYATGADLDHLAMNLGVRRLVVQEGDDSAVPPVAAVMEGDGDLRRRYFLALHSLNTAGARGAYVFHAFSCPEVKDVTAVSFSPGVVTVTVLGRAGDGVPHDATVERVREVLSAEDVRPLTDSVVVRKANVVRYGISARLVTLPGPDAGIVLEAARKAVESYAAGVAMIGRDVTISGVYSALHQPGVERVILESPLQTVSVGDDSASFCTGINLAHEVMR